MHEGLRKGRAFVVTGAISVGLSLLVFTLLIHSGAAPRVATSIRLAVAFPILYVGYSRFMLGPQLVADRRGVGALRAEARMFVRVVAAIAASILLKLLLEPLLVTWFVDRWGTNAASLAPLVGDFGYGPLVTYLVLIAKPLDRS